MDIYSLIELRAGSGDTSHRRPKATTEPCRCGRTRKAFTLIELLVVITIIGILAAMLFPVFGKIRARALGTKSASNLRQIMFATLSYAAENNNMLPMGTGGMDPTNQSWDTRLLPFGVTTNVLKAPLHKYSTRSYWVNANGNSGVMWADGSASLASLTNAANTIAFLELRDDFVAGWETRRNPGNTTTAWGFLSIADRDTLVYYYNNFAPFAFCDGHVEMLTGNQVSANNWQKIYR